MQGLSVPVTLARRGVSGQPGCLFLDSWQLNVDFNLLCEEGGVHIKWTPYVYSHLLVILALDGAVGFNQPPS